MRRISLVNSDPLSVLLDFLQLAHVSTWPNMSVEDAVSTQSCNIWTTRGHMQGARDCVWTTSNTTITPNSPKHGPKTGPEQTAADDRKLQKQSLLATCPESSTYTLPDGEKTGRKHDKWLQLRSCGRFCRSWTPKQPPAFTLKNCIPTVSINKALSNLTILEKIEIEEG